MTKPRLAPPQMRKPSLIQRGINRVYSWGKPYEQTPLQGNSFTRWARGLNASSTANDDMVGNYRSLRAASRKLMVKNPIAVGAKQTLVTNAVGPGLRPEVILDHETLGMSREAAKERSKDVERRWHLYADSTLCDMEEQSTFSELQGMVVGGAFEAGEIFANLPYTAKNNHVSKLKVQLIEPERVDNPSDAHIASVSAKSDRIFEGIELSSNGAPARYFVKHWTYKNNVKEERWESSIPHSRATGSRQFLHMLHKLRPGQTRGMPLLTPVIQSLKELGDYQDYEIRAALVAGLYTVFVESEQGDVPGDVGFDAANGDDIVLGSGSVIGLGPGETVNAPSPGRPNPAFDAFMTAILRQIGMGLGIPYELLVKHFTASYSASRAALLEAWKTFRMHRNWLAAHFCQPVFVRWMDEEVALGRISAPGYFDDPMIKAAWNKVVWIGLPREELDPQKTAAANLINLNMGTTTRDKVIRETSDSDFDNVHDQSVYEFEKREDAGFHEYLQSQEQDADTTPTEIVSKRSGDEMIITMNGNTFRIPIGDDEDDTEQT